MNKGILLVTSAAAVVSLLILTGYALLCAVVAQKLWVWHVMPVSSAIPMVSWHTFWAVAAGGRCLFGNRASPLEPANQSESEKIGRGVGILVGPLFVLLIGWWLK